ncbi:PH domain-containing protein [Piscinibacter aquaticus]|uniref:PH domain-containing protein n=1 Tax=Piscinibacter aquaticus TaxID=392597 RepID=A0A5C6U400_9BURK|nr:PH domain-containing protein [Piscinibacter aquaticus]
MEHEDEPVYGLPEVPPAGEHVIWQGSPDWKALAIRAFHVRKLVVYFALMLVLRATVTLADGGTALQALRDVALLMPLPLTGWRWCWRWLRLSARSTVYTLTNRRVVMRIGIVLTLSFNLPFRCIAAADMARAAARHRRHRAGLAGQDRIAYLQLWPHARPWHLRKPQPMLRCVPEPDAVAQLLAAQWSQLNGMAAPAGAAAAQPPAASPLPETALAAH